jgi:hypothetical protein
MLIFVYTILIYLASAFHFQIFRYNLPFLKQLWSSKSTYNLKKSQNFANQAHQIYWCTFENDAENPPLMLSRLFRYRNIL